MILTMQYPSYISHSRYGPTAILPNILVEAFIVDRYIQLRGVCRTRGRFEALIRPGFGLLELQDLEF